MVPVPCKRPRFGRRQVGDEYAAALDEAERALHEELDGVPGAFIERKRYARELVRVADPSVRAALTKRVAQKYVVRGRMAMVKVAGRFITSCPYSKLLPTSSMIMLAILFVFFSP